MSPPLPGDLVQAYLRTAYHVESDPPFVLRIGRHSPALAALFAASGTSCAAFLTAWNPFSQATDAGRNAESQRRLERDIAPGGWRALPGFGRGDEGDWPPERSVLVLGVPLATARIWAGKYRQNAFLWCPESAVPELALTR
jgi:hypothetical protein